MLFKLGYFGKQPKNLLASVQEPHYGNIDYTYTYTYGFEGKDGYVSSRTITINNQPRTIVQKYTWE